MGEPLDFDFDKLVEAAEQEYDFSLEAMEQRGLEQQFQEESDRAAMKDQREMKTREEKHARDVEKHPEFYNKPVDERGLFGTALRERQTAKRKQAELGNVVQELENNDPVDVEEIDPTFAIPRTPSPPRSPPRPPSPPPVDPRRKRLPVNDWTIKYTHSFSMRILVMLITFISYRRSFAAQEITSLINVNAVLSSTLTNTVLWYVLMGRLPMC